MMIVSAYCNKEKIKQLDQYIKSPVSRSQVFEVLIEYVLKNPIFLQSLIEIEQEKIERKIAGTDNSI